jgi:DNA-directed RNA polymerase alpha subunit
MSTMPPDPRLLRRDLAFPDYVLDVRVATINALTKGGIKTLGDLIEKTPWDLLEIRQFGQVSLRDVQSELAKKRMHLKGDEAYLEHYRSTTTTTTPEGDSPA